jgi:uncharacterized protein YciU (UPF0263 family)
MVELTRRKILALMGGGAAGVIGYRYMDDYVTFAADPDRFIEPDHENVLEVAGSNDEYTDTVDMGLDFEYKADAENFISAGDYLEHGVGDCEDHAFATASILEAEGLDWKMVVEPGHTETHFKTDDGVYSWHVGEPKNPESNKDQDWTLMFDLQNGLERYEKNWHV